MPMMRPDGTEHQPQSGREGWFGESEEQQALGPRSSLPARVGRD